jgi:hypothetical protein
MAAIGDPEAPRRLLDKDSAGRAVDLAPQCTVIFDHFLGILSSRPMAIQGALGADATVKLLRCGRFFWRDLDVSDRSVRYGMIALDAAPTIVRVRGAPLIFHSPEETVEYAQLHDVQRWMV